MLNPLSKLKRFSSAAAKAPVQQEAVPAPAKDTSAPAKPVPTLTQEQLIAMANPRSFACEHCKRPAGTDLKVDSIMYMTTPNFKLWLCFTCLTYYWRNGHKLPPIHLPLVNLKRLVPKKVPSVKP